MKAFKKVKLIKQQVNNPKTNYQNLYWSEGYLLTDIKVGELILLARYKRADYEDYTKSIKTEGIFNSSTVQAIDGNLITTKNSVWEVLELEDEEKN